MFGRLLQILSVVVIVLVFTNVIHGQHKTKTKKTKDEKVIPVPEKLTANPCSSKMTCGECITADKHCAWCSEETDPATESTNWRCDYYGNVFGKCSNNSIVYPGHQIEFKTNVPLSDKGAKEEDATQIKPQRIQLKIRPNSPLPIDVEFRQAVDYPVDLYYLMDLSKSMEDDKSKLAVLGDLLGDRMGKITQNFRLGFGSFVDKTVMPYVSTVPERLKAPCSGCAAPYGFINHMPLSLNTSKFTQEVTDAKVSGNLDAPEGGFDAIMQAIVCKKQIGWREKSRKMLLFSTDSGFHYAGDGKLGGIVKPNDGNCHLDEKGYYTESTTQDYPSLSQINHKIQKNKVNIIFAVTENQIPIYERLSEHLEGSSTGKLANDSSNVVDLVQNQYDKISTSVELKDNATDNIRITYKSKCFGTEEIETNVCKGLKVGTNVTFKATIEVLSCPKNREEWKKTIHIYPVGLNEALIIDLEMICECDCEKLENEERNSMKCANGSGTYECGICTCNPNRYGRRCECDAKDADEIIDEADCIKENGTKPCSGQGICRCGTCDCKPNRSGRFCECDDTQCDFANGQLCGGPTHGECVCGECRCKEGWTGSDCNCTTNTTNCISPSNGKMCHGNGNCECDVCKCFDTGAQLYTGAHCEECLTCPGKCDVYRDCVQCYMFKSGALTEEECNNNCSFRPLEEDKVEAKDGEKLCVFRDESDDCKFTFVYNDTQNGQVLVRAQRTKDCPEGVNILWIILAVILGIVAIGLALLLIWKLLTTIHDRREFAKFEKERQMARWDTGENPIYKQATSTFKNPTYGGK